MSFDPLYTVHVHLSLVSLESPVLFGVVSVM